MRNPLILGGAWLASLVLAWLLGANFTNGGGDGGARSPGVRTTAAGGDAPARDAAVNRGSGGTAATEHAAPAPPPASPSAGAAPGEAREPAAGEDPVKPFSLEGLTDVAEASALFMAYADRKLDEGADGHKELLKTLDRLVRDKNALRRLVGDEQSAVRLAYPWVKFLVDRDRKVIALTETIYRTAAEDPEWFRDLDDDTLEPFTEGIAMILAGAADEATLERFRGYAEAILARPPEALPEALQKSLRDIRRNLEFWAPPVAAEDVLQQLMDPSVSAAVKLNLLRRVDPKGLRGVDVAAIVGPAIQNGDNDAMRVLGRFSYTASDLVVLDRALIEGAASGRIHAWWLQQYLRDTKRETWAQAEALVREGLRRGEEATEAFAQGLAWLPVQPPKAFVQEVIANYALPDMIVAQLKQRYKIE